MTMTTTPSISQKKRKAFQGKDVYDHDHPLKFPIEEESFSREGCV